MKISNSSIAMAATHRENSFKYKELMTIEAPKSQNVAGVILNLSQAAEGKSIKESMVEFQKQQKKEEQERQKENEARYAQSMLDSMKANKTDSSFEFPDKVSMQIKLIRQILAALRGEEIPDDCKIKAEDLGVESCTYARSVNSSFAASEMNSISVGSMSVGTTGSGTVWQKITAVSGFAVETESTTFASKGIVCTADGRNIDFNVEVSMSRAYMSKFDMLEVKDYIKTDPLIINLDTNVASVSDQKFFFDLDSDGDEEEISFAGKGSGFLAIDKNNDGKINNGSELFGTKSGDGFKDLAIYDEDGNGWIDENDAVFSKLKIWTKDENGNDYLIDLKRADVGAIYLSNTNTQFSLKDEVNNLNAEVKRTGIYLKESTGMAGTLNHVDLAI